MKRIHCTGILVVDALSGPLEKYPVPKVASQSITESVEFLPGGGAANTTSALAKMGLEVGVFSKVGDDPNGEFLIRRLGEDGVDTSGIKVSAADSTPFTFVGIHPGGDRTFIHTPGANKTFSVDDIQVPRLMEADILFYHDLWVLPKLDGTPGAELLAEARSRGIVTILDECWGLGPNRETFEAMLPHCDYVLPSFDDMLAIYPGCSSNQIADIILELGASNVVVKMGADGCLIAAADQRLQLPVLGVEVVDTTGAGDCWDAGFVAGLASDMDVVTSAKLGNACAACCIEAVGGATGVPDFQTVRKRAKKL